jgi:hypothetical protein
MSAFSDYVEQKVLDLLFNGVAFTAPSVWVALYTTDPTDAKTGAEVSGGSYARVRVYANGGGTPDWSLAVVDAPGFKVANHDDIVFPTATVAWGTITHVGVLDAGTLGTGNLLMHGQLTTPKAVGVGDTLKFSAGDVVWRAE